MGDYQGAEALSELANDTNNCETETELQALAVSLAEAKETEPSNQHFVATVPHPSYRNEKHCSFFSALSVKLSIVVGYVSALPPTLLPMRHCSPPQTIEIFAPTQTQYSEVS